MRFLLDTHVFLWLASSPERLGRLAEDLLDPRMELLLSAASSWEIAIKHGLGRLDLPDAATRWVPRQLRELQATAVPVDHAQALAVGELPNVHGDPFDRLLVVTSRMLGAPLITADPVFARYDVDVVPVA